MTATGAVLEFLANETIGTNSTIVLLTDGFSFDDVEEAAEKIRLVLFLLKEEAI